MQQLSSGGRNCRGRSCASLHAATAAARCSASDCGSAPGSWCASLCDQFMPGGMRVQGKLADA